jgi:hypothetical protein
MKHYLGDGAYVEFDGYAIVLTTSNGIVDTNRIVLEPEVLAALLLYIERLRKDPA